MSSIDQILNRSVTAPFYRRHAGLFLFLFFILFGVQPSMMDAVRTHYYIILSILTSPTVFLIATAIWFAYTAKTVLYFRGRLISGSYDFIFVLNALTRGNKWKHLANLQGGLMVPVWLYAALVIGVGVVEKHITGALLALVVVLCLFGLSVAAMYFLVQQAKALQAVTRKPLASLFPKSLFGFLTRFIFTRQFPALLIVKSLSFFSLYFFSRAESSVFEDRMLWLIFITALIGHSFIVYRCFGFMEKELRFYRNLPVTGLSTLTSLSAVYILLLIPEAWALRGIALVQDQPLDYIWMLLAGPALLLLLHCLLYTEDMKMEEFLKLLFGIWVVFIFFSLSRHHWIIPAIGFVFAVIIFRMSYRRYEKEAEVGGLD